MMKQLKTLNFNLLSIKTPQFTKLITKNFSSSKVYDNIVKLSNDYNSNEIKIPAYGNDYTIYYKSNELVSELKDKIVGTDEKIVSVDFVNMKGEVIPAEKLTIPVNEFLSTPFNIRINNYIMIKYLPSLNMLMPVVKSHKDQAILNSYNFYLYQSLTYNKDIRPIMEKKINDLLKIYEEMMNHYIKSEEILNKRYDTSRKRLILGALLYAILHFLVFMYCIYYQYGWDEVEPATYITANVYWIIGLSFFVFKRQRLDVSFFNSLSFKEAYFSKHAKNLGFSEIEKNFIMKEIKEIKKFKETINKGNNLSKL